MKEKIRLSFDACIYLHIGLVRFSALQNLSIKKNTSNFCFKKEILIKLRHVLLNQLVMFI